MVTINPSLSTQFLQPVTIYVVVKASGTYAATSFFGNGAGGGGDGIGLGTYSTSDVNLYAGTYPAHGATFTPTNWNVIEAIVNGSSSTVGVNGSSSTVSPGSNPLVGEGFSIGGDGSGGDQRWNGWIAEAMVYIGTPTSGDDLTIRKYLYNKYNISGS